MCSRAPDFTRGSFELTDSCSSFLLSRLRQPSFHHLVANNSRLLKDKIAIAKDCEVWNPLDFVASGELRECFRVDFDHDGATGEIRRSARDFGSSHSTGSAPRGPEVDEHRNTSALDNVVERLSVNGDWL